MSSAVILGSMQRPLAAAVLKRPFTDDDVDAAQGVIAERARDVERAEAIGDAALNAICETRLAEAETELKKCEAAINELLRIEARYLEASARLMEAEHLISLGTLDAKEAVRMHHDQVAYFGAERATAGELGEAHRRVVASLSRITKLRSEPMSRARKNALDGSHRLWKRLLLPRHEDLPSEAFEQGAQAQGDIAIWWPLAEVIAIAAFEPEAAEAAEAAKQRRGYGAETPVVPDVEELHRLFEARRAGFQTAVDRAEKQLAAMKLPGGS